MKAFVYFAICCLSINAVDAGPTQCHSCIEADDASCSANQKNQTCASDPLSLGTTHCASVAISYYGNETDILNDKLHDGFIRGCIDCGDKTAACFALMGALKAQKTWSVRECSIECCTGNNCNKQTPNLHTGDGKRVFTPEADWPKKCNSCSEKDAGTCAANEQSQTCVTDPKSLGTGQCASVLGQYRDKDGKIHESFFRGCLQCTHAKRACFSLGGFFKRNGEWTMQQCAIDCCQTRNCNTGVPTMTPAAIPVFPETAECNSCFETDSASCKTNQKPQFCATSEDSLGTSHCASMAGSFRDQNGNKVNGFYRGCVDCSEKKIACSTIGGFIKANRRWSLGQCEITCCTGSNCNTHIPTLSDATSIQVFQPPASGQSLQCLYCLKVNSGRCYDGKVQVCARDRESLGTRQCYSAAIRYWDESRFQSPSIYGGYVQGCIDSCEDEKAACAAIAGLLKDRKLWTLTECKIHCCTGDKCNTKEVFLPYPGSDGFSTKRPTDRSSLSTESSNVSSTESSNVSSNESTKTTKGSRGSRLASFYAFTLASFYTLAVAFGHIFHQL
ncbi:uncharacterized skeletal organic matrix protein 2 [Pocillopora verrucosa]|uniref:uncharacterized skeletal organic matrix protein 2 n=1 Tax=Pocillopora verrucosa TaxID=203993 RepID=UPI00333F96EA